jgi:UDP-2,3-diacylglucosamine hydrolase
MSDAHLGLGTKEEDREKERRILAFFDQVLKDADRLYILGDLFDAWIEYRTVIPKGYHRVLSKLEEITTKGIETFFLVGNHDFWMRDYFQKELGITVYKDPFETKIDGKRFYIHHGDGLASRDGGYRLLKKVLRNPFSIWLYTWVHPDIGYAIARGTSHKSRGYTAQKDYGSDDGMVNAAREKIRSGFDVVVMGHRHIPLLTPIESGVYVNLGDWITHNTYAVAENGAIELKKWI